MGVEAGPGMNIEPIQSVIAVGKPIPRGIGVLLLECDRGLSIRFTKSKFMKNIENFCYANFAMVILLHRT